MVRCVVCYEAIWSRNESLDVELCHYFVITLLYVNHIGFSTEKAIIHGNV